MDKKEDDIPSEESGKTEDQQPAASTESASGVSCGSNSTIRVCLNSVGNNLHFLPWFKAFDLNPDLARRLEECFGSHIVVLLAAQDYIRLQVNAAIFDNIIEIFDIKHGTTMDHMFKVWGTDQVTIIGGGVKSLIGIFESADKYQAALCIKTKYFKTRKILDASELALIYAVEYFLPEDRNTTIKEYSKQPGSAHSILETSIMPLDVLSQHEHAVMESVPRRFPQWDMQWSDMTSQSDYAIRNVPKGVTFAPGKVLFTPRDLDQPGPSTFRGRAKSCEDISDTSIDPAVPGPSRIVQPEYDLEEKRLQGAIPRRPTTVSNRSRSASESSVDSPPLKGILRRSSSVQSRGSSSRRRSPTRENRSSSAEDERSAGCVECDALTKLCRALKVRLHLSRCAPSGTTSEPSTSQSDPIPSTSRAPVEDEASGPVERQQVIQDNKGNIDNPLNDDDHKDDKS